MVFPAEKVIRYTFYSLFFLVPLLWLSTNSELFEFNKMLLVYAGACFIVVSWLIKTLSDHSFTIKRTPLDIPILVFLGVNLISTIFSLDPQTSIFGYYSRFNGGLLSTLAYLTLFYALLTFLNKEKMLTGLKILLLSAFLVSLYGILQHPNPLFRAEDGSFAGIDAGYWKQDSEARVFATLGHPNWLAAFLLMVTPLAFYFLIFSQKIWLKLFFALALIAYFTAFTFTYSRGGTLGLLAALGILLLGAFFIYKDKLPNLTKNLTNFPTWLPLLAVVVSWALIFNFFGNAFISRGLDIEAITQEQPQTTNEPQLSANTPETGKLRLIVWAGALKIFQAYPLFGSGPETFTFSYYQFRPLEQNLTQDWNILYNKAHNEFLNYLATTGALGLGAYLFLIITFLVAVLSYWRKISSGRDRFFIIAILAGLAGYHMQNFFSFSVVAIALLFFLFPAFAFSSLDIGKLRVINLTFLKNAPTKWFSWVVVGLIASFLAYSLFATWFADYFYSQGLSSSGQERHRFFKLASGLRPDEPLYKAYAGLSSIELAQKSDSESRRENIKEGLEYVNEAVSSAPKNLNIWIIRLQAIYDLSRINPSYLEQAVETAESLSLLAPTDGQIQYNLANIYFLNEDFKKAQEQLEKVVDLKPDYAQAWTLLLEVDNRLGDYQSLEKHKQEYETIFPGAEI